MLVYLLSRTEVGGSSNLRTRRGHSTYPARHKSGLRQVDLPGWLRGARREGRGRRRTRGFGGGWPRDRNWRDRRPVLLRGTGADHSGLLGTGHGRRADTIGRDEGRGYISPRRSAVERNGLPKHRGCAEGLSAQVLVPAVRERLLSRLHYLRFICEPPDAWLLFCGCHSPFGGADEGVTPTLQYLDVAAGGGVVPHLGVHGRGPEDLFCAGEDGGREEVVAEAYSHPRHGVGGGGGDEDEVGPTGQRDVFDPARLLPPGLLGVDVLSGSDRQGFLRDKVEGGLGGYGLDLVIGLP